MVTSATREQLDELINQHFTFEATDDLDGVMGSLADEVEHEIVPSFLGGTQHDKANVRQFYTTLFEGFRGESVTPIRRYYGDDFVVDETMWQGHVDDGKALACPGKSGDVSFRLLHVFEVKDGKISREQAWCDLAALQQQLGVTMQ